jgi:hypothetical protein
MFWSHLFRIGHGKKATAGRGAQHNWRVATLDLTDHSLVGNVRLFNTKGQPSTVGRDF